MCGIWFSVGLRPPREVIHSVVHRGPDGTGWIDFDSPAGPVVLAHHRLAIIDVGSTGRQPMSYNGRWWIAYNGEVYNHKELRYELQAAGRRFETSSDTEVILAAYAQWGPSCLNRFIGMFSFVIYDKIAHTVFAARDRFGVKPLYYVALPGMFAVASEIKQLLILPCVTRSLNFARAFDFLTASLLDHTNETMFAGVYQLRGGEAVYLELLYPDWNTRPTRWYNLPPPGTINTGLDEAAEQFAALLDDAVRLHLRSDVRVGSCLSGGLDSSSIVCLVARQRRGLGNTEPFTYVTSRFKEKEADEGIYADSVGAATGLTGSSVFPRPDDFATQLERLAWHQDEPFGSTSIFAQWCVFAEAARLGIKVMLDGQGADEQLAGYHGMFPTYYLQLLGGGRFVSLARTLLARRHLHQVEIASDLRFLLVSTLLGWVPTALLGKRWQGQTFGWLRSGFQELFGSQSSFHAAIERDHLGPIDGLGAMCRAHVLATSLPALLHYEDRSSMAHGIEARVPFLDHRLVEFSIALGDNHKMRGAETKAVLRRAMKGLLPEDVRQRQDKLGFATPEKKWLLGPARPILDHCLSRAIRRFGEVLDPDGIRSRVKQYETGQAPADFTLWRIASFGVWGDIFGVTA
jgi:asparagine synthase (glutamine-hydrolysing)